MWEAFKIWFADIQPDLMKILKALVKIGVDVLQAAIGAVMTAVQNAWVLREAEGWK